MIRYATAAVLGTLITVTAVAIRIAFRNFQREARATLADVQRTASAWRDDLPVEFWPAEPDSEDVALLSVITCCWCKNQTGTCGCKIRCSGHQCRGRLTLTTWNEHDFAFAARHGFSLPERSEHQ
jgi:hypothetical protein